MSNPDLVKVCKKDEVCLIYSWDKTEDEKGNNYLSLYLNEEAPFELEGLFVIQEDTV